MNEINKALVFPTKVTKNVVGLKILIQTLSASKGELVLLVSILFLAMLVFASVIYYAQRIEWAARGINSDLEMSRVDAIESVPVGLWWAVITLTTIGYGDKKPTANAGFCIGFFCAIASALAISLPMPIIVNNFAHYYSFVQAQMKLPKKKRRMLAGAADALKHVSARILNVHSLRRL